MPISWKVPRAKDGAGLALAAWLLSAVAAAASWPGVSGAAARTSVPSQSPGGEMPPVGSPAQQDMSGSTPRGPGEWPSFSGRPEDRPAAQTTSPDYAGGGTAGQLLGTPVTNLYPGDVPVKPGMRNPVADDPQAVQRGMRYFTSFNCVGCHAPNGGGGMGPALSNRVFIYGSEPANIYLTIFQGRPRGMPAWGAMLPDTVIWDLVAYVKSISQAPSKEWGMTVSRTLPQIEQVPAEYLSTTDPWGHTQAFSGGRKPNAAK